MCRGRPFILLNCFVLCIWSVTVNSSTITDWEYVLLRVESNTSNPDIVNFNLRPIRVSRGVYALNGNGYIGKDLDNTYSAEFQIYRSSTGSNDYKATPLGIQTTTFYKFMNSVYVKMLQKDFQKCANTPQYKDEFEGPLTAAHYEFKKCMITTDGMPGHLQPGIYRATVHFFGDDVEMWLSAFFEVSTKSLI